MIKNIIILVLLLALGAMYWLSFPEEKAGSLPTAGKLQKHAMAAKEKIKRIMPVEHVSGVNSQTTNNPEPAKRVPGTPQHSAQNHQAQNRESSIPEQGENGSSVETMIVASRNTDAARSGSSKASSAETLTISEVSSLQASDGATKEKDLSRSELEEVLSLLRQAKSTLRKKLFPVQPPNPPQAESSISDESSPIKKKSFDGREKWE